jgi:hypothetical protein
MAASGGYRSFTGARQDDQVAPGADPRTKTIEQQHCAEGGATQPWIDPPGSSPFTGRPLGSPPDCLAKSASQCVVSAIGLVHWPSPS